MAFQVGDGRIEVGGDVYGLRLTLGAVAELSTRLDASGPRALASRLRNLTEAEARLLLACLLRPCTPSVDPDRLAATLNAQEMPAAIRAASAVIVRALEGEKNGK